eukprot:g30786.t2
MLAELASGSTHEKTIWEEVAQADAEVQCDDVYLLDMASWEAVKEEICQLERARNEQLMQELKEERERAASKHVESLAVEQGLRQELRAQEELLSESRTEEKILGDAAREVERAASKQVETLTLQRELKEEQRAFAHQREKLLHEERAAQKTPVEEHVARLTDELLDEQRAFAQQWETWLAKEERAASSMESVARLTSHALKEEQRGFASQREKLLHEEAELDLCRAAATKREELFRNELSAAQTQTAAERARAASAAAARHRVEEAQRLRTLGTPARAPSPAPSPARSPPIEPIAELKRSLSQQLPDKKPQPLPRRAHRSVGVPNGAIGLHRFGFDALRAEIAHAAAQHRSVLRRAATATAKPSPSRRLPRQLSVRPESSSSEELVRVIPRAVYADRTVESGCRQSAQSPCRLGGRKFVFLRLGHLQWLATLRPGLGRRDGAKDAHGPEDTWEVRVSQRITMALVGVCVSPRQSVEGVETSVSQSPISEPISEISDRKSLDALDALDGNIWKDFDSFNISNFSALEVERFEFHHVLRASDGVRAQIEVHSDLVEGTKVVVKRFPRAYLKDSPAEFRQSNHTLEDPWKEMFLALKLGAPGSASQISGVLPCHGIFIHPSGDVMLFMEYATSGDLFDFATALGEPGPAREAVATQLLRPLVHVVLQLHQMGIAHGDISAENAILCEADGEVSVALLDFAMAVDTSKPRRFSAHGEARGKPMYRPPEEWSVDVQGADLFACGVLGYALAIGNYPWQSTSGACKAFDYVKKKGLAQFFRKRMIPMGVASPEGRVLPRNASHGSGSATAMVDNTGVDFPLDAEGKRSTTGLNQGAFAAAVEKHSAEAHEAVLKEKKWRFGYARHVLRQTQLAASKSDVALGIARDGLDYLHSSMQFCRDGGCSLKEAMAKFKEPRAPFWRCLTKAAFYGARPPPTHLRRFTRASDVYPPSGIRLSVAWASAASPQELDTAFALCNLIDRPEWLDLSDHTFVLFGAGSAMGPFPLLMQLGAHVVALDLPKPEIWKSLGVNRRLISVARRSPGKLTLPLHEKVDASDDAQLAAAAGCDLLRQTPEVRNWLLELGNSGKCGSMVLGAYCYADGPLFVRVSMAMDAIIADLVEGLKDRSRCWGSSWALRRWAWCLIG